jgi:hypothetical protein
MKAHLRDLITAKSNTIQILEPLKQTLEKQHNKNYAIAKVGHGVIAIGSAVLIFTPLSIIGATSVLAGGLAAVGSGVSTFLVEKDARDEVKAGLWQEAEVVQNLLNYLSTYDGMHKDTLHKLLDGERAAGATTLQLSFKDMELTLNGVKWNEHKASVTDIKNTILQKQAEIVELEKVLRVL